MRRLVLAAAVLALGACPKRGGGGTNEPPGDPYPGREQSLRGLLLRELEVEMIEGYELPSFEMAVPGTAVSSRVGAVHVGVGPLELFAGVKGAVDRWPLLPLDEIGAHLDEARSKRLEMHLSDDLTAAWVYDEVSYRVPGCVVRTPGKEDTYKVALMPLRLTAVFVRDGERWVEVLEHISYPQRTGDLIARSGKLTGSRMRNGVDPRAKPMESAIAVLQRAVAVDLPDDERRRVFASDRDALALWPDPDHELRGGAVVNAASLAASFDASATEIESWRIGMSPDPTGGVGGGSLAWAAITLIVDARRTVGDVTEVVPIRLRATYVLERRELDGAPAWQVVQSHVSSPVDAGTLLGTIGTVGGGNGPPWTRPCEGAAVVVAPEP